MKYRIILLPNETDSATLTEYSQSLGQVGEGFRLDQNHIPHITIVAFEVDDSSGGTTRWEKLREVLLMAASCDIDHVAHYDSDEFKGYVLAHLSSSDSLRAVFHGVRELLMEDIEATDFAKYSARPPHLTLGVELSRSITIPALPLRQVHFDRLALAQSGEYGSVEGPLSHIYLA